jgi:hypothetical protein
MRGTSVLATADEVQRFLRIFLERFRPTDFYETNRMLERPVVGLNFQELTFGRSDTEQEPHSRWTIVHRRAMPLFADLAIAIHRAHHAIGAGTNPRPSSFPPTFRPKSLFTLLCGFMTRVLGSLQTNFPQQRLDV